jgi:hypothetical protein
MFLDGHPIVLFRGIPLLDKKGIVGFLWGVFRGKTSPNTPSGFYGAPFRRIKPENYFRYTVIYRSVFIMP